MRLSILIPTRGRRARLLQTLLAWEGECRRAELGAEAEIVVVDDGAADHDGDDSLGAAASLGAHLRTALRLVPGRGEGPAAARNLGVAACRGERVLLTGDDMEPAPGALDAHLSADAGGDLVVGRVDWHPRLARDPLLRFLDSSDSPIFRFEALGDGDYLSYEQVHSANTSLPRALLAREPFDADFPYAAFEDTEWALRLLRAGTLARYRSDSVVLHDHPYTLGDLETRQRRAGWAAALLQRRHAHSAVTTGVDACRSRGGLAPEESQRLRLAAEEIATLSTLADRWPPGLPRPELTLPAQLSSLYKALSFAAFCEGIECFDTRRPLP